MLNVHLARQHTLSSLALIGWVCLVSVHAQGQEKKSVLSFQTTGVTVIVDAVVTDKRNRVVTDLRGEDFVIYEDGVKQQIDTFEFRRPFRVEHKKDLLPDGRLDTRAPLESPGTLRSTMRESPNLIIFLLDYATTRFEDKRLVQEASIKYVQENLQLRDYVAVFGLGSSFHCLQDFTNDREKLVAALQWQDISGNSLGSASSPGPTLGIAEEHRLLEPVTANVSVDSPQQFTEAAEAAGRELMTQAQLLLAQRIQNMFYTMMSFVQKREARSVLRAIRAIARGVEEIPERKTLILLSQGFVVGPRMEPDLEVTISMANKANLAIYAIDSQGLTTGNLSGKLVPN